MGQTEEFKMMSRPNRMVYTPITRGHKPTASQESNTLSQVSCYTTISQDNITEVAQLATSADSIATMMGTTPTNLTTSNSVLQQPSEPSQ